MTIRIPSVAVVAPYYTDESRARLVGKMVSTDEFRVFLTEQYLNGGFMSTANLKSTMRNAGPFLSDVGGLVKLSNGCVLAPTNGLDHRIVLHHDLYAILAQIRHFERAHDDHSGHWISASMSKLLMYQLWRLGAPIRRMHPKQTKHMIRIKPMIVFESDTIRTALTQPISETEQDRDVHNRSNQMLHSPPFEHMLRPYRCETPSISTTETEFARGLDDSSNQMLYSPPFELETHKPPSIPLTTPTPLPMTATIKATLSKSLYPPPTEPQQLARTCALSTKLRNHLKSKNMSTRAHKSIRHVIHQFYQTNPDLLAAGGLQPLAFDVDHVIARAGDGLDVVYNLVLMEPGANSHFGDRWDTEKRRYVGELAAKMAVGVHAFYKRDQYSVDFSKFNHLDYM